ncbi:Single-stranded DNA-binding protein [Methylobacterium crusticola]|uniref:Single-stranded DNA-binding protein n=2 Tax=Methylobacterium crusticola TaxID=1697972 RepID=A0ABQ4R1F6_9HYPH|nr:single-stranded DNA-binding protein [Methylobacterium crusticola]GJD51116.1 Single-stranded DNA-binding protein [Methylobacterium crusticola]
MSGSLNQVQLIGHLGQDPETRRTQGGDPVVSFRIATSESWKDKATGDRKEQTEWHSVVIFNEALCRVAEQYLKKGSKVFVQGKLQTRKWQNQAGVDRYSTEVVLARFGGDLKLLDKAERAAPDPDNYGQTRIREPSYADARSGAARPAPAARPDLDDDIPF